MVAIYGVTMIVPDIIGPWMPQWYGYVVFAVTVGATQAADVAPAANAPMSDPGAGAPDGAASQTTECGALL
jgi:hypothetical protein